MFLSARSIAPLFLFALTAAACGDSSDPVTPPRTDGGVVADGGLLTDSGVPADGGTSPDSGLPPPRGDFCEGYQRGCELQVECGTVVYNHGFTIEACLEQTGCARVDTSSLAAVGVTVDAAKIADCRAKLATLDCGQVANFRSGTIAGFESCVVFTSGTIAEGEACSSIGFEACQDGMTCEFPNAQCPGECTTIPEPCRQDGCNTNEYCSYVTGACTARGGNGASCEPNLVGEHTRESCQDGFHCLVADGQPPVCTPRIAAGAECDVSVDIELCAEGFYCDPASMPSVCVARLGEGQTCNFFAQCREELYCDFDTNTCRAPGQLGEACNASAGSCVLGLECDTTCKRPEDIVRPIESLTISGANGPCGSGFACGVGLICTFDAENNKICTPALAPGAECEAIFDVFSCLEGLCGFETDRCPDILGVGDACGPDGLHTGCPFGFCVDGRCLDQSELVCDVVLGG